MPNARMAAFYASEAPQSAPDRVLEATIVTMGTTRQLRAFIRAPSEVSRHEHICAIRTAAVSVTVVGAIGLRSWARTRKGRFAGS
jgi:hypothetical protein